MTKELNIRDLMESEESKAMILQVLNVDMKNQLRRANMHELGKASQYYTIGQHDRVELKPAL